MNNKLSLEFGDHYARIPLKSSPHIRPIDALDIDWNAVLPSGECTYVLGNPPFIGAKYQSEKQRKQVREIAGLGGSGGTLDYVTAWFLKASEYIENSSIRVGFVATNSITQGEQVAQLWPLLFRRNVEIIFAHRTFAWGSDARGKAHVHVAILGLCGRDHVPTTMRLFSYDDINGNPVESHHKALSPYLIDASTLGNSHLVVVEASNPLGDAPKMIIGSKPIDGGYLILDEAERADLLAKEPKAEKFIRPFVGAVEYLQGGKRWILALQDASASELRSMPAISDFLKAVKEYRQGKRPAKKKADSEPKTPGISSRALADTPAAFHVTVIPEKPFLCVPEVSSERRAYVPIGWLEPPTIPSNLVRIVPNADLWHFAILTSRMHMAWLRNIGGRLKSDYRYSIGIVYNPFPWPASIDEKTREHMRGLAKAVIDARKNHPGDTLADLYDPDVMPADMRKAHAVLDDAVDRLYRKDKFQSDRDRVEHLFGLYEKLISPLTASIGKKKKGASRANIVG